MAFTKIKFSLLKAAEKYKLNQQALSALVCEKARQLISREFPEYQTLWQPKKFVDGELFLQTANATASSALYMKKNDLLDFLSQEDLPASVQEIKIIKA